MPHPAFIVHLLNDLGKIKASKIAKVFDAALEELGEICPSGREWSIVVTKLEEACFFAKKAMANDTGNSSGVVPPAVVTADGAHDLVPPPPAAISAAPAAPLELGAPAATAEPADRPHDPAIDGLKPTT